MGNTTKGSSNWTTGALLVALSMIGAATAEAQEPIALPLSIHIEHDADGPIAQDAYVDYAVELANRWLRPAGVCVFPASRHPLRNPQAAEAVATRHAGRSVPVAVVNTLQRDNGDGLAGWGRSGPRPLVMLSTMSGKPFTLAHEIGHVLGEGHVDDEDDVMHRHTPADYDNLVAPRLTPVRAARMALAARRLQRRVGRHPAEHCATPRALPHPSTLASGHPVLTRSRRPVSNGVYTGEQFFAAYHGSGSWVAHSGYRYRGEYRLGKRHGWGEEVHPSGNRYVGAFADGDRNGYGVFSYVSGAVYRGDYRRNDRHGRGVMVWADGGTYVGDYRNNRRHGQGRQAWPTGMVYEGAWVDGEEHGHGCKRYADGDVYEGPFVNGLPHGHGEYRFASGTRYEGPMRRGRFHGQGRMRYRSGGHYRGAFEQGLRHGFGRYQEANGTIYEGHYRRGERHGEGTVRFQNGRSERRAYSRGRWLRRGRP